MIVNSLTKFILFGLIVVSFCTTPAVRAEDNTRKHNVIVTFTDGQGYQDFGCFGAEDINTPNIDSMTEGGVKFTNFYASSNICTPSRLSLLTGAYTQRMGWKKLVLFAHSKAGLMKQDFKTLPELMKEVGYAIRGNQLFNLHADIGETNDLASEYPELVKS